jgi:hypothetical protein
MEASHRLHNLPDFWGQFLAQCGQFGFELLQCLLQRRGLAILVVRQVAHLRGEAAGQGLNLTAQARLQFLQLLGGQAARCQTVFHLRQFQRDARLHGLPNGFDDLAELGRQPFLQRGEFLIYPGNFLGAGSLGLRHVIAHLGFDLLNGFLDTAALGGRVLVHSLQIQGELGVHLGQAPVNLPDMLGETSFERDNHFVEYA